MQLLDLLIEADPAETDLDWCTDPSDLERAIARLLVELEPGDHPSLVYEKLAKLKLDAIGEARSSWSVTGSPSPS